MPQQRGVTCDEILWLLGSLSGLFRIPFDAALIAQAYPPPYTATTFHDAARSIGLKTGTCGVAKLNWPKLPLPAIAFLRPLPAAPADEVSATLAERPEPDATATGGNPSTPRRSSILIVRADADKLLYFRSSGQAPETLRITDAPGRLEPELILVAKDAA